MIAIQQVKLSPKENNPEEPINCIAFDPEEGYIAAQEPNCVPWALALINYWRFPQITLPAWYYGIMACLIKAGIYDSRPGRGVLWSDIPKALACKAGVAGGIGIQEAFTAVTPPDGPITTNLLTCPPFTVSQPVAVSLTSFPPLTPMDHFVACTITSCSATGETTLTCEDPNSNPSTFTLTVYTNGVVSQIPEAEPSLNHWVVQGGIGI